MTMIDRKTVNDVFDARIIGAWDLVQKGWSSPIDLPAPRANLTVEAGCKHVGHVGYMILLSIALTISVLVLV